MQAHHQFFIITKSLECDVQKYRYVALLGFMQVKLSFKSFYGSSAYIRYEPGDARKSEKTLHFFSEWLSRNNANGTQYSRTFSETKQK